MSNYQEYVDDTNSLTDKVDSEDEILKLKTAIKENPNQVSAYYNLAVLCHSLGKIDEAIENFQKTAKLNPLDASIFNNLGVFYYKKSDLKQAEANFRKAILLEPSHVEAIYSLGKIYLEFAKNKNDWKIEAFKTDLKNRIEMLCENDKTDEAWKLSEKLIKLIPDNAEYLNNHAVISYELNKIEEAHEAITKAKELSPDDTGIQENYQLIFQIEDKKEVTVVESGQDKIAFFCGPDDNFLNGIMAHLSQKYEVKRFQGGTVQDMHDLMKWSSVSWFEWCDNFITHASKLPKVCKTICRLHSYEAFTDVIRQINWKTVDDLVFVAPHIRDIVTKQLPNLSQDVNIHVIFNGVDLEKYSFKDRQKGFNIAYVGYINHKKNPALLLQCIKYLVDIDDRYVLHVAGKHQELRFQLYFEHIIKEMELEKNVVFHGWIDDVNGWLEDKHFTVSTSVLESFCHGIADAMACGLKPLIHNFIGAKELYPQKYIFNSVKDFSDMVINDDYNPAEYRKYIKDNYSQDKQLNEIENLLESVSK
jgi:tetratricopeptide (TPR) repeat protein